MKHNVSLDTFDYNNDDYILMRYESYKIPRDELYSIYEMLRRQFPNSKIIAIPNDISIKSCGKKDVLSIYEMIKRELGVTGG